MKIDKSLLFILILTMNYIGCISPKQSTTEFDKLLCKKWMAVAYEENGNKYDVPNKFQSNRMQFSLDHSVESSNGQTKPSIGEWNYNDSLKTITIIDKMTKEVVTIEVKSLNENEFVVQMGKAPERTIILYMKPDGNE